MALIGVFLIKDPELDFSVYYLLGLIGAAFAALSYNFVRTLRLTDHPLVVLSWFQIVLLPVSSLVLLSLGNFKWPQSSDLQAIFLLALFSFLAQVCLTLAYQKSLMAKAASVNFLAIPLSVVVGYVFFKEELKSSQLWGILLVFAAVSLNTVFKPALDQLLQSFLQRNKQGK